MTKLFLISSISTILLLPGYIWYSNTGSIAVYLSNNVPQGQLLYVLSKLLGLYAMAFIAWQVIASLLCKLNILSLHWLGAMHSLCGILIFILALSHAILFFLAATIRQGVPAWGLFLPNFSDFYHTYISVGLAGLGASFVLLITGVMRIRNRFTISKKVHAIYFLSICLIYIHALSIGSDAQSRLGLVFYIILGGIAFFLWLLFVFKRPKLGVIKP